MSTRAKRDQYGRRLFRTEDQALRMQERSARDYGVFSGVTQTNGMWYLLHDPTALFFEDDSE